MQLLFWRGMHPDSLSEWPTYGIWRYRNWTEIPICAKPVVTDSAHFEGHVTLRKPGEKQRTLAERMRAALPGMSPGERRIVRICLSISAPEQLATISVLADMAGVSSPTVLRCLDKIGFDRFSDFRDVAMAELAAKHESALAQMSRKDGNAGHELPVR